jgi:uncharacterized protein YpbB
MKTKEQIADDYDLDQASKVYHLILDVIYALTKPLSQERKDFVYYLVETEMDKLQVITESKRKTKTRKKK